MKAPTKARPLASASGAWDGFEPTGYELDWKRLTAAPLTEIGEGAARIPTTVGAVLQEALAHLFVPLGEDGAVGSAPSRQTCEVEDETSWLTITTPNRVISLDKLGNGGSFAAQLVQTVIKIDHFHERRSFHPIFFYYDRDDVVDDVHDSFSFFVVNDNQFVLDRVTFSRHSSSGFDPQVFRPFFTVDLPDFFGPVITGERSLA